MSEESCLNGHRVVIEADGEDSEGNHNYAVETSITRSGQHGMTVRVRPSHPDMSVAFLPA